MELISHELRLDGVTFAPDKLVHESGTRDLVIKGQDYLRQLKLNPKHEDLAFLNTLPSREDLDTFRSTIEEWAESKSEIICLGTGGSSIGGQALSSIFMFNKLPRNSKFKLRFLDNLSYHQFKHLLDDKDISRTHFLVISKSGNTAETLAQCLVAINIARLARQDNDIRDQFTIITQPGDSALRRLAEAEGFQIIDHAPELGGRFSALSVVGMLPAMALGFRPEEAIDKARETYKRVIDAADRPEENLPLLFATLQVHLAQIGYTQSVFMPYDSRLVNLSRWYQQLWAESLGKEGSGTTPLPALGPLDQHSQLQLFLDGPKDKFFTFILGDAREVGYELNSEECRKFGLDYLAGNTIGDLVHAEANASVDAISERCIPTRILRYKHITEGLMAEIMAHFILETIIVARIIGINPFDQPAVERSKYLTRAYLSEKNS